MDDVYQQVKLNPSGSPVAGAFRMATARATRANLEYIFGDAHSCGDDVQFSAEWYLITPRGRCSIRDFWSNAENEWSIIAPNERAATWAISYLRKHGIKAEMDRPSVRPSDRPTVRPFKDDK